MKTDYSWIKVKRYVDDPSLSWEERYRRLEEHHEKETKFLIAEVERLRGKLETTNGSETRYSREVAEADTIPAE